MKVIQKLHLWLRSDVKRCAPLINEKDEITQRKLVLRDSLSYC